MDDYTLSADSARRVANVVRRVERMPLTEIDPGLDSYGRAMRAWATCGETPENTVTVCGNPIYSGVLLNWDHNDQCWANGADCWITEINGVTLTNESRYAGDLIQSDFIGISDDTTSVRPLVMVSRQIANMSDDTTCTTTDTLTFVSTTCVDGVETTSTITVTLPFPATVCEE